MCVFCVYGGAILGELILNVQQFPRVTSPFSERFPWRAWEVEARYTPPPTRGISAILARCPLKTRQMGAIPGIARLGGGGISHWAAKATAFLCEQGKNRDAPLLSETLQNKIHACKTRSAWKIQGMVSIQNEIRTRSERATNLHNLRPWRDKTG